MRFHQLGLFSREQINTMRDRTPSRNWSPDKDAFRREHERRRKWGPAQRHGFTLLRLKREAQRRATEARQQPHDQPRP
ncbi:hypothetical protein ACQP2X_42060 [Actinoplanes sp. CA-131856]